MSVILGTGDYQYRVAEGWGELPDGWELMDVAAGAVDHSDRAITIKARRAGSTKPG